MVNGWDEKRREPTLRWYHVHRIKDRDSLVCTCPMTKRTRDSSCHHIAFLRSVHGEDMFPDNGDDDITYYDERSAILFERYSTSVNDPNQHFYHFSVPARTMPTIQNRAIVQFEGNVHTGSGSWSCTKDLNASHCSHIHLAKLLVQTMLDVDRSGSWESGLGAGDLKYDHTRIRSPRRQVPISYRSRPPPIWSCISDAETAMHENRPGYSTVQNEDAGVIPLLETDACVCSRESTYNPFLTSKTKTVSCVLYGLSHAKNTTIEVQDCQQCRRRLIGPDCQNLGVFNWNNRILVSEALLDDYTSSFAASETPFAAYAIIASRRYRTHKSAIPFMDPKVFVEIWFAYISLVQLDLRTPGMCPRCGPNPETTIWDGVTLSFHRKHLRASLEPPTTLNPDSEARAAVVYVQKQQCFAEKDTRQLLGKVLNGTSLVRVMEKLESLQIPKPTSDTAATGFQPPTSNTALHEPPAPDATNSKEAAEWNSQLDRLAAVPAAAQHLQGINHWLGEMFERWFGLSAIAAHREAPDPYYLLFKQLIAEESVLQMINRPGMRDLAIFIADPSQKNISHLIAIPTLYDVVRYELATTQTNTVRHETFEVLKWLHTRAGAVMEALLAKNGTSTSTTNLAPSQSNSTAPPASNVPSVIVEKSWKKTGCHYAMTQLRHRPKYDGLQYDQRPEPSGSKNQKRGNCSKWYSQYSEDRQTGGIMCVWCPHSICYGFHCIPKGEGRNDVFSALYTRWEKAPKRVIYDFACALGPYCLTREPEFFLDTEFRIDSFHAKDHTKCAPATFLATYAAVNPILGAINTSAGECGNSGLLKVRKSVSYMSQDRAIMYTHVYLALWNRLRVLEM